jgi:hypothetical protein
VGEIQSLELTQFVFDWKRHLKAKNFARSTILSYVSVAEEFREFQADVSSLSLTIQIEAHLATVLARSSCSKLTQTL